MGAPAEHWYYSGRDHVFFGVEADVHQGQLTAFGLPAHPPGLRQQLVSSRELALEAVSLVSDPA
jgi:hypothetical protein